MAKDTFAGMKMCEANEALDRAFEHWVNKDEYPNARTIGDVVRVMVEETYRDPFDGHVRRGLNPYGVKPTGPPQTKEIYRD